MEKALQEIYRNYKCAHFQQYQRTLMPSLEPLEYCSGTWSTKETALSVL